VKTVVVDLFAGAGGTSTGIAQACKALGRSIDLLAINHWPEAIATHEANHPWARHILDDVRSVNPLDVVEGGHVHLLSSSPECTWYSRAAGGRPRTDQNRASAWDVLRWPELLRVDSMLMENVPEFMKWGPRDSRDRIIRSRRGETFQAYIHVIRSMGYNVDYRILNAADYGAATSRSRFFLLAHKGNKPIAWPEPTRSKKGIGRKKWRGAKEVIDWSLKGRSIYGRKRSLATSTIRRIMEGFRRFGGAPYLVLMEQSGRSGPMVKSVDDPTPTITTAHGGSFALTEPFLLSQGSNGAPKSVEDSVPAIMTAGKVALIEPFVLSQASGGAPRSVGNPLPTIVGEGRGNMLVEPYIVATHGERGDQKPRVSPVSDPAWTITSRGIALVQPFVLPVEGYFHKEGQNAARATTEPIGTITQRGGGGLVEPFVMKYNRTGGARSISEPLDTLTAKERYGLVIPTADGDYVVDFLYRMLQPYELAAAMGFPRGYVFKGNKTDAVKQIGNAVVVDVARALTLSLLTPPLSASRLS